MKQQTQLFLVLVVCFGLTLFPASGLSFAAQPEGQTSLYGIGSTSKVLTTAAVLKLSGEGKIDLDQPLISYLPDFSMADNRYKLITPRMLLDHTSGIFGSTLTNAMLLGDPDTDNHDHLLDRLKTQRLKADPGAFGVYCNDGFTLAELLVEQVSGKSFTQYLEDEFSAPLKLSSLKTPQSPQVAALLAPVYEAKSKKKLPPEFPNVIGSGGIYATAEDLCRISQIFMRDPGETAGILPTDLAQSMEYSSYETAINPLGRDSNLAFGLGWDSVSAYPFQQYGIKALVKGGDTTYYHASLTVLPEENIACAVLTSGGSSNACQLAVQEILLAYLEEIKRIDQTQFPNPLASGSASMPQDLTSLSGWYGGAEMFHPQISEDGTLILDATGTGKDKQQVYTYRQDGTFHSDGVGYLSPSGTLTFGSGGTIGRSFLEFQTTPDANTYLMAGTYETLPGLGTLASYLPLAQKLNIKTPDSASFQAWKKQSGKTFYLTSEKYSSALWFTRFCVKPLVGDFPAGYVTFDQGKSTTAQITGPSTAEYFQQIPGQAGRDLLNYRLEEIQGSFYLDTGISRYVSEDSIPVLPDTKRTIVINDQGDAQWFVTPIDRNNPFLTIQAPPNGSYYIYDEAKKEPACVASSYTNEKGRKFLLPAKGSMVFVGEPGASFSIQFSD